VDAYGGRSHGAVDLDLDVAVVGGGIAGVSVAGELARRGGLRVAVLEREKQLAYHTSGRSAAAFLESYGSPEIRALTQASRATLDEVGLLHPRPLLWLAPPAHAPELAALVEAEPTLRIATDDEVRARCPVIRPGWAELSAIEDGAQDLDVAGLLEHYRRLAVTGGVGVHTGVSLHDGSRVADRWVLRTSLGRVRARVVVNAAGAWADDVARRCGQRALGLVPYRRTIAVVSAPSVDRSWPLVADVADQFYFRPEGDGLLISPADETPSDPVDARPETEDVALALERVNAATTLNLRHVRTTWAGLRTFAPDRNPVVGFSEPGFCWLAGQGGYGMQTAPAMAALAAAVVLDEPPPPLPGPPVTSLLAALSPGRFAALADPAAHGRA
jgi:Glycine/D-amino acid oxidases (deaminating)